VVLGDFNIAPTDNDVFDIESTKDQILCSVDERKSFNNLLKLGLYDLFEKFDFESGLQTESDSEWDVAFRGTTIIVNGGTSLGSADEPERTGDAGVYIFDGTMDEMTAVETSLIIQDSADGYAITPGSGNGWYTYAGAPTYLISPTPGKILVFRTRDGKYAKMEILSYYLGAPENPDAFSDPSRYYTFNYVYQPNEGVLEFN